MREGLSGGASHASVARRDRIRHVALVGVAAALSFVLGLVGWTAPSGGRVSLSDVPVLLLALLEGGSLGMAAGALAGLLHFPQQPVTVHPLSVLIDFPLAASCLGLAGWMPRGLGPMARAVVGVGLAVSAKLLVHTCSGVLFWSQGLEGTAAWRVSLLYNASYMGPRLLIDLAVVVPLSLRLQGRGRASSVRRGGRPA